MKSDEMLYFFYGSNILGALIEECIGPCDAYCTGDSTDRVRGATYRLTQDPIADG